MGNEQFALRVTGNGEGPVVLLAGDLDLSTVPQLRECLHGLTSQRVMLDFSGVTFMDSTAIGVLMAAYKRAESDGGEIVLHGVQPSQMRLLEITGLTEYVNFFDGDAAST